ncbi:MAG TPA: hypothetical protein VMV14_08770 [Acidimicrobiales bacterium]|nr:hypothetical protein [Acidimicrobiales bacterium]
MALAACTGGSAPGGSSAGSRVTSGAGSQVLVVAGAGWDPSSLHGPVPAPGSCRLRVAADGRPLPDPVCTPGVVNSDVTQSDLATTICRVGGYSDSVRPPESLTEAFKARSLAAYGESKPEGGYELDHLVPLGLGGASDTRNLWAEPDDHPGGAANSKDPVETELHDLVCDAVDGGRPYLPLAAAQQLMASDWTTALAQGRAELVG